MRVGGIGNERSEGAEYDVAALRIAERVRSSLDLREVLQSTVDELGRATGVSRSLVQLAPGEDGVAMLVEWDRGDTRPLGVVPPTIVARRVFGRREAIVFKSLDEADDEVREYLTAVGSESAVAIPVRWHREVLAVLGVQDSKPRDWRTHVLPLLERVEGQVGAALAQAALFERQQEALERLRQLDRMRDELLANVSHELRTPLTSIIGAIKTLRRNDITMADGDRAQLLAVMDEQADRLFALTDDILELSRFTRGRQRLNAVEVRLSELAERATAGLDVPEGRDVALEVAEDAVVRVDPSRIGQVLVNLMQNAIRHGHGRVTVRCFRDGASGTIWVGDEGPGVPRGYEDEMFDPFAHRSDRTDSTGLGLSIARAIVRAHGGTLTYLPPEPGRTHQFAVSLPLASATPRE